MKFKFIILGSDDNAYGISRSIHKKYKTVPLLLCNRELYPTRYSKILEIKKIDKFDIEENCIKEIIKIGTSFKNDYDKLILVPCSDWYMEICSKNREKLKDIYANKFIDYDVLKKFITKDKFYELCDEFGLNYPKTIICKYDDRNTIVDKINFTYPIILKPNNSNSTEYLHASFKNKKKVFFVKTKEELQEIINNINESDYKDNLIIQEFINGDDTNNRVINCYNNQDGSIAMMSLARPILEEYSPNVLGNYAAIINEVGYHELFDKFKNFLEGLNYTGFSNFDIKYDSIRKKYYVFEINYRQGRSSYYLDETGISLAQLMVDDLVYNKVEPVKYSTKKNLWLNVPVIVLNKYIRNIDIRKEAFDLLKNKNYVHTLKYKEDYSLKRRRLIRKTYLSKIRQYKKYFIEK